ncbi:MAG TPA: amidohydrolase family protein [Thermoanaerobaculia bacterium]|jgi:imidazolonepropionase-like amidohydrolase|nr:amidohydrolase family protein [Thermoanaerobaculia bacterium]
MKNFIRILCLLLVPTIAEAQITAIKAGRLIDPETGTASTNQVILIEGERIKAVGADLAIPAGAAIIDLSKLTVLPGLVDAHTHTAITYKEQPENNYYYLTYIMDSTPLRAIQAASNAIQLLNSGFTVIRDVGNNAMYADCALRQAIEQGWLPGPTVIPSGPMIGSTGGQFWPTPEMYKNHSIMFPEYIDANSPDEIVRAVRENMLFGARTIKLCIDCKPWGYSVDDIKLAISEAAKGGCKVEGHVQTPEGAQRAIDAGIYIIGHGNALTPEHHKQMAEKGIFLNGTDTPLTKYRGTEAQFKQTVAKLRDAWEKKVPLTFSTDFDYWNEQMKDERTGEWLTRGEMSIAFLDTWKAAGIPAADTLRALTINGYKAADIIKERGPIKAGYFADLIAVAGDPLTDIDTLRSVQFVVKNGMVFKRGGVMTPEKFFHPGPVRTPNGRWTR